MAELETPRQLGTRVDVRPSTAIADEAARARVSAALAKHGVVALAAEPGLTPSQLARFTHLLCKDAGGGSFVATTSDTYEACLPCSAAEGGVEGGAEPQPGVALVLSNVALGDEADRRRWNRSDLLRSAQRHACWGRQPACSSLASG